MLFTFVYLHGYEEMNIVNGSVFFLVTQFKIIDFLSSADLTWFYLSR